MNNKRWKNGTQNDFSFLTGVVYYHELMQEKAKQRALQRKSSKANGEIKLGSMYKSRQKRQPRSMLQIRESLKQMMEAEVIGK